MRPIAQWSSDFTPGPGGVRTDEVGVVTGPLTLRTDLHADGRLVLNIQYLEADEWYVVSDGRCRLSRADSDLGHRFHQAAVDLLAVGGADAAVLCPKFRDQEPG